MIPLVIIAVALALNWWWTYDLWRERHYYRLRVCLLERWDQTHDERIRSALQTQPQPQPIRALKRRPLPSVELEADRLIRDAP